MAASISGWSGTTSIQRLIFLIAGSCQSAYKLHRSLSKTEHILSNCSKMFGNSRICHNIISGSSYVREQLL